MTKEDWENKKREWQELRELKLELVKEKKRELQELQELKAELISERQRFLEDSTVQDFLTLEKWIRETSENYDNLKKAMQEECPHPIWFALNRDVDPYEGRIYLTCRCLECGKVKEAYPRDFSEVIFPSTLSLGQAISEWEKFKDTFPNTKDKAKTFIKVIK